MLDCPVQSQGISLQGLWNGTLDIGKIYWDVPHRPKTWTNSHTLDFPSKLSKTSSSELHTHRDILQAWPWSISHATSLGMRENFHRHSQSWCRMRPEHPILLLHIWYTPLAIYKKKWRSLELPWTMGCVWEKVIQNKWLKNWGRTK